MSGVTNVKVNGAALVRIMQSPRATEVVNAKAAAIARDANGSRVTPAAPGDSYVVHPRKLRVSSHAFVDCDGYTTMLDNHYHDTLQKAFWMNQG